MTIFNIGMRVSYGGQALKALSEYEREKDRKRQ